jgi:2-oxo-4-hydroxy-4-carboxy-5-ureidoimidazoline decarboxylase
MTNNAFVAPQTAAASEVFRHSSSAIAMPLTLTALHASDRAAFVSALGHLFEHSPWVAEETWERLGQAGPFRDAAQLHAELCRTMQSAPAEKQLALIRAHPDLAGRLARQNQLTKESTGEQASAGLNQLSAAELAAFQQLNDEYRAKFGFPFVICARLNARDAIVAAMKSRLLNSPSVEHAAALGEIEKIAWLRLSDSLSK